LHLYLKVLPKKHNDDDDGGGGGSSSSSSSSNKSETYLRLEEIKESDTIRIPEYDLISMNAKQLIHELNLILLLTYEFTLLENGINTQGL
jgi:hypothetical protein